MNRRRFLKTASASVLGPAAVHLSDTAWARRSGFVVVEPKASDELLVNPGMGFETFHCFNADERIRRLDYYPECSIAYYRFYWDKLEPREGRYDFDQIDSLLDRARDSGQDLALRFMPMSTTNERTGTPLWYMERAKTYRFERSGSRGGGYDNMWDEALKWGGSAYNPKSGRIPPEQIPSIERFIKRCGYRFEIKRIALPQVIRTDARVLPAAIELKNTGVAPPYRDYVPALRLTGNGRSLILRLNAGASQWLPGERVIEQDVQLPGALAAGNYRVSIGILQPGADRPAIRTANPGVDSDGWYVNDRLTVSVIT